MWVLAGLGRPQEYPAGILIWDGCSEGRFCQMPRLSVVGTHASPLHFPYTSSPTSLFLQARDVCEEAIRTVMTVRDFTQVFDSYAQFEEYDCKRRWRPPRRLGRRRRWAGERSPW